MDGRIRGHERERGKALDEGCLGGSWSILLWFTPRYWLLGAQNTSVSTSTPLQNKILGGTSSQGIAKVITRSKAEWVSALHIMAIHLIDWNTHCICLDKSRQKPRLSFTSSVAKRICTKTYLIIWHHLLPEEFSWRETTTRAFLTDLSCEEVGFVLLPPPACCFTKLQNRVMDMPQSFLFQKLVIQGEEVQSTTSSALKKVSIPGFCPKVSEAGLLRPCIRESVSLNIKTGGHICETKQKRTGDAGWVLRAGGCCLGARS